MPMAATLLGRATVAGVSGFTRSTAVCSALRATRVWLALLAIGTLALIVSLTPAAPAAPVARAVLASAGPLAGRVIGIDPGHNGHNWSAPAFLAHQIWNGRELEDCDTTGTSTDGGYTEAQFNFNVARYLRGDLLAEGARVVMTRNSNVGVGPCVTTRARIIDAARANVAIDIHADGGPPSGRGFAILLPVADGVNDRVIAASE